MNDSFLQEQGVSGALIESVRRFRESYPVAEGLENRMSTPEIPFFGKEILEMAIAALLQGENLLLTGEKATGKNVLAETLAYVFGRPTYNVSFHVNTGSAELIGTDTFQNQEVTLRKGSIYRCAEEGGFGILDEINMAKNDAVSVLHAALDYRRIIDVPGYDKIPLHPAAACQSPESGTPALHSAPSFPHSRNSSFRSSAPPGEAEFYRSPAHR